MSAADILRAEIEQTGPISFERFMDVALYHPQFGYYRRERDPFGREGDFYTAAQLQPSFGRLIRAVLEKFPVERTLIDIGAGRGEMREQFHEWKYIFIDAGDELPSSSNGVIFANELFDALPCRALDRYGKESLVTIANDRFIWTSEPSREECKHSFAMLDSMARALNEGYVLIIDYGYDEHERALRFPNGSLMSYRSHIASEDVLDSPGERDITAHVNFTAIERYAASIGFEKIKRSSLASFLLDAGEEVVQELSTKNASQLKHLLFGMGEVFQALLLKRLESPKTLVAEAL